MWLDHDGRRILTTEPYNLDGADLQRFLTDIGDLGLTATITGQSLYYPGYTFMIFVTSSHPHE